MPRRPRVEAAGFHHIVNRGVAGSDVYHCREDKDTFLKILCHACDDYKVNVHDYCLMDNHYHLVVETTQENLSLFMRRINSNYAIFFNKKYERSGHLWQGRYKSWYIYNEEYLYTLFRYIEHNPFKSKLIEEIGQYDYTLLAPVINKYLKLPKCAEHSKLKHEFYNDGIQELLEIALSEDELKVLQNEQKKKIVQVDHEYKPFELPEIETYFKVNMNKDERNIAIIKAIEDGYKQSLIAGFLGVSASTIVKIKNRSKVAITEAI